MPKHGLYKSDQNSQFLNSSLQKSSQKKKEPPKEKQTPQKEKQTPQKEKQTPQKEKQTPQKEKQISQKEKQPPKELQKDKQISQKEKQPPKEPQIEKQTSQKEKQPAKEKEPQKEKESAKEEEPQKEEAKNVNKTKEVASSLHPSEINLDSDPDSMDENEMFFQINPRKIPYSIKEDEEIVNFMLKGQNIFRASSISIWKYLESKKEPPKRSHQSLKNRFLRNIRPHLFTSFSYLIRDENTLDKILIKYPELKNTMGVKHTLARINARKSKEEEPLAEKETIDERILEKVRREERSREQEAREERIREKERREESRPSSRCTRQPVVQLVPCDQEVIQSTGKRPKTKPTTTTSRRTPLRRVEFGKGGGLVVSIEVAAVNSQEEGTSAGKDPPGIYEKYDRLRKSNTLIPCSRCGVCYEPERRENSSGSKSASDDFIAGSNGWTRIEPVDSFRESERRLRSSSLSPIAKKRKTGQTQLSPSLIESDGTSQTSNRQTRVEDEQDDGGGEVDRTSGVVSTRETKPETERSTKSSNGLVKLSRLDHKNRFGLKGVLKRANTILETKCLSENRSKKVGKRKFGPKEKDPGGPDNSSDSISDNELKVLYEQMVATCRNLVDSEEEDNAYFDAKLTKVCVSGHLETPHVGSFDEIESFFMEKSCKDSSQCRKLAVKGSSERRRSAEGGQLLASTPLAKNMMNMLTKS